MVELYTLQNKNPEQIQFFAERLLRPDIREWLFDDRVGFIEIFTILMQPNTAIYLILDECSKSCSKVGMVYITDIFMFRDGILNAVIFDPSNRGKGKFLEVADAIERDLFEKWRITTVETWIREDNIPAIKLVEKLGFQWIGVRRKKKIMGGELRDLVIFDKILSGG